MTIEFYNHLIYSWISPQNSKFLKISSKHSEIGLVLKLLSCLLWLAQIIALKINHGH
jgi:hypothetical protein